MSVCTLPICFHRQIDRRSGRNAKQANKAHVDTYHRVTHTFNGKGWTFTSNRDPATQLLSCRCGNPLHERRNYYKMRAIMIAENHELAAENNPDPHIENDTAMDDSTISNVADNNMQTDMDEEDGLILQSPEDMEVDVETGKNSNNGDEEQAFSPEEEVEQMLDEIMHKAEETPYPFDTQSFEEEQSEISVFQSSPSEAHAEQVTRSEKALRLIYISVDAKHHFTICTICRKPISPHGARRHAQQVHGLVYPILPSKQVIEEHLQVLNAFLPPIIPTECVPAIPGIQTFSAFKCEISGCNSKILGTKESLELHWRTVHPSTSLRQRTYQKVKAQPSSNSRKSVVYFEVTETESSPVDRLFDLVVSEAKEAKMGEFSTIYQPPDNTAVLNATFAHVKWDNVLSGVDLSKLQPTAQTPDAREAPLFPRLQQVLTLHIHRVCGIVHKMNPHTLKRISSHKRLVFFYY